jgi:ABC-type multidrug transport system fused ATPase/permease subunit
MNEGKVVEQGSFKELRSKNGLFTEMIESQFIEES